MLLTYGLMKGALSDLVAAGKILARAIAFCVLPQQWLRSQEWLLRKRTRITHDRTMFFFLRQLQCLRLLGAIFFVAAARQAYELASVNFGGL